MAGLEKLLDKYDEDAEKRDLSRLEQNTVKHENHKHTGSGKIVFRTELLDSIEITEEEIEERFKEYEEMRGEKEWVEDENYIPDEEEEADDGEAWEALLRRENEEIEDRKERETLELQWEVCRDLKKYLGVDVKQGRLLDDVDSQPVGTAVSAVRKKNSQKNLEKPPRHPSPPSSPHSSISSATEQTTHDLLQLIHSRDAIIEDESFTAANQKSWDELSDIASDEEVILRDPAPKHLSQREAEEWEKSEREKIRHLRKVEKYTKKMEEDRAAFKEGLKNKAAGKASYGPTVVTEHLKKKQELAERARKRDEARQKDEEAARMRRLEENKERFRQAQRNNKVRAEAKAAAEMEKSNSKLAERARREVKDDLKKLGRSSSLPEGVGGPTPPASPPPLRKNMSGGAVKKM